jgi:hypothetical protein
MTSIARVPQTDEPRGVLKAVVDPETHRSPGAAIAGIEGGAVMSVIEGGENPQDRPTPLGAMAASLTLTLAESLNNLFPALDNEK